LGGARRRGLGAGKEERGEGEVEGEGGGGVRETGEGKDGAEERFKDMAVLRIVRGICMYDYRRHWQSHQVGLTYRLKTRVSQVVDY
jgi:hypothetical protein